MGETQKIKTMKILDDVKAIVGERQEYYNDFAQTMELTAEMASRVLNKEISGAEVSMIYVINKLVRSRGKAKRDNILDDIAYLAIIDELCDLE
jgi:Fe-S cluster assembly ATPase SufC